MAVPTRINSQIQTTTGGHNLFDFIPNYIVETPTGVIYLFYINSSTDPVYIKSIDGGFTWGAETTLKNITCTQLSIWYDRWSGINSDIIHVAYTDSGSDDIYYRNVDAANSDSLGTEYVILDGSSTANGGALSICRMRGGNLICIGCIDAGTEVFSRKSTDVGINWSNISAGYEENADQCIVMPGWGADNQDAMMFYYDRSAQEVSVKYYDDSGDSWSETSLATTIVIPDHSSTSFGHISCTVDNTNSQNLLVFWTAVDTGNADLRCFKVTQSAQTEVTNVVLNSVDDQGFCSISIFGSDWYVYYGGISDGTEAYLTQIGLYYKISNDNGVTWGSEIKLIDPISSIYNIFTKPITYKWFSVVIYSHTASPYFFLFNAPILIPHSNYQIGI